MRGVGPSSGAQARRDTMAREAVGSGYEFGGRMSLLWKAKFAEYLRSRFKRVQFKWGPTGTTRDRGILCGGMAGGEMAEVGRGGHRES